jgi:rhodanese-related sulfurtransferase
MRAAALALLALGAAPPGGAPAPAAVCAAASATTGGADAETPEISTDALRAVLADGSATVLDVRPPLEYAMGHVPGARNVAQRPGTSAALYVSDAAEVARLVGGRRDAPLVLYCNGPFCGKSRRLAAELRAAGFSNVRRYQLGIPVWRALGGVTQIEREGARRVLARDGTAVWLDARPPAEVARGSVPGARAIPLAVASGGKENAAVQRAKDDGTLPMEDHNARIVVLAATPAEARAVAEALAREAFHNVSFYDGPFTDLAPAATR